MAAGKLSAAKIVINPDFHQPLFTVFKVVQGLLEKYILLNIVTSHLLNLVSYQGQNSVLVFKGCECEIIL